MKISELKNAVKNGNLNDSLVFLYGEENLEAQKERFCSIIDKAEKLYGDREAHLFSAPGRTEVGGNHTDHQHGRVVAASINLDVVAVVVPTDDNIVRYASKGFSVQPVDLSNLDIVPEEKNSTEALIRGTAAGLVNSGYEVGGFSCYAESDVVPGGGMSSSAAFEVLLGTIFSELFNEGGVSSEEVAINGQYAENVYFMKPCGLLDQMACSMGSFAAMDFADPSSPVVEKIDFNPADYGYDLILTDVKASHADLSDEYGAVPAEMKSVANILGEEVLGNCTLDQLLLHTARIRANCGDRAYLRAFHFLNETQRAKEQADALKAKDMKKFLKLVNESGRSSWMYLQNIVPAGYVKEQPVGIALAVSDAELGEDEAFRVHGGGFAGTIQAYVKQENSGRYIRVMESVFGEGCCYKLRIRQAGGIKIA